MNWFTDVLVIAASAALLVSLLAGLCSVVLLVFFTFKGPKEPHE